jgi:(1->4)-alpha-D-glucan 1-alpha-D-glucosylmutase
VLDPSSANHFLGGFAFFQKEVSGYGMYNSLSQTLLKIAAPGVPDFYQGTEIWDYSLVDPDNRRPVDYTLRRAMLAGLESREQEIGPRDLARELVAEKENGRIKLYLIRKALTCRRENRELFEQGDYVALDAGGEKAEHVCAFARRRGEAAVIIVAPRYFTRLVARPDQPPTGREVWGDTIVTVPSDAIGARYRDIFTGEITEVRNSGAGAGLALSELCAFFPVACVEKIE